MFPQGAVVHYVRSAKELVLAVLQGRFTLSLFRRRGTQQLMNGCSALRILLICIMCLAPSASMYVSVYPRSLGDLWEATDRP